MEIIEELNENQLKLKAVDAGDTVKVPWQGKSNDRNPSLYLGPFFEKVIKHVKDAGKKLELDFTQLQYMNSSTITPVVQLLDQARESGLSVFVLYDKSKSWQEISFSAMTIFESGDPVIKIVPV